MVVNTIYKLFNIVDGVLVVKFESVITGVAGVPGAVGVTTNFTVDNTINLLVPRVLYNNREVDRLLVGRRPTVNTVTVLLVTGFVFNVFDFNANTPNNALCPLYILNTCLNTVCNAKTVGVFKLSRDL